MTQEEVLVNVVAPLLGFLLVLALSILVICLIKIRRSVNSGSVTRCQLSDSLSGCANTVNIDMSAT